MICRNSRTKHGDIMQRQQEIEDKPPKAHIHELNLTCPKGCFQFFQFGFYGVSLLGTDASIRSLNHGYFNVYRYASCIQLTSIHRRLMNITVWTCSRHLSHCVAVPSCPACRSHHLFQRVHRTIHLKSAKIFFIEKHSVSTKPQTCTMVECTVATKRILL